MTGPGLIIIPFIDCHDANINAFHDAMLQLDGQADILLIDNGSMDGDVRRWSEGAVQSHRKHARLWRHAPPLPSLAATWNRALDYAWESGYADAMVWNNDIRCGPWIYELLRQTQEGGGLWFSTPVNVAGQPNPDAWKLPPVKPVIWDPKQYGGPDFSCFLITPECHEKYRFDERFQPAYHEDGDYHRRMWLGGDGDKIAGVTLPYLHYGSRTIHRSEAAQVAFAPQFAVCRQRYVQKWGGEPHHERRIVPDSREDLDGVETPGGYLATSLRMPDGYATLVYPMRRGMISGIEEPDVPNG